MDTNTPITIRVSEGDKETIATLVKKGFYMHKSDVTRSALRIGLEQIKKKCGM